MAKYSAVAPPEFLLMLKEHGLLGDYHLVLAHDVVERPKLYEELFNCSEHEDDFIIMDNSLCELGKPVTREVMKEACDILQPDCVVLPDCLQERGKTLMSTGRALGEWSAYGVLDNVKNGFMVVPQGKTYDIVIDCIVDLHSFIDGGAPINYWSIPKVISEVHGSRMPILRFFEEVLPYPGDACIHLLGFGNLIKDDLRCAKHSLVMGIDSALPVRMGLNAQVLNSCTLDDSRRGDFWEQAIKHAKRDELPSFVTHNINYVRRMIG